MDKCQLIKANTSYKTFDILLIRKGGASIEVLMSGCAFPVGTSFPNCSDAVQAAVRTLEAVFHDSKIEKLTGTATGEDLIKESELETILPNKAT